MNKIDNIFIFGTESCEFCKMQIKNMRDFFPESKVSYLDVQRDEGHLKIAQELDLEFTPTTVVLSGSNLIFKRDGIVPADELFFSCTGSIPITNKNYKAIQNGEEDIFLSFDPLKNGKVVLQNYEQNISINANVKNIKKINQSEIIKVIGKKEYRNYNYYCKKDEGYLVKVEKII